MKTNLTATIYNRYVHNGDELYRAKQVTAVGKDSTEGITVYIPWSNHEHYLSPIEWQDLPVKNLEWTIQEGDAITLNQIDTTLGSSFTLTDLKKKYPTYIITAVSLYKLGSTDLWHWKVKAE